MYEFKSARQRGGEKNDDRNERVDELLNEYHTTAGYGEGPPLAANSYSEYPDERPDLANPDNRSLLVDLFSHAAVSNYEEAAQELVSGRDAYITNDWINALQSATKIHNVDAERLFDRDDGNDVTADDVLDELLDVDDDLTRPSNPLVISELYCDCGLSVAEISDLLDSEPADVTEVLRECGLLAGYSTPDPSSESDYEQNGRRGGGLRIHA